MKNILWVSASVPYDNVAHAGGKIHNFYLKFLKKNTDYDIKLISYYWEREKTKIDLESYQINSILLKRCIWGFPRTLVNIESFFNPFNRYAGVTQNYTFYQLKKALKQVKREGFAPQIVILQWTEMLVLIDTVKRVFPNAIVIGIEEDVLFLNFQRAYQNANNFLFKKIRKIKYDRLKKIEIAACNSSDKVILNNIKDYNLLKENNIDVCKLHVWQPFFENRLMNEYKGNSKNIIFYGAMGREENWKSAIWFIENVFYKLNDQAINFLIIGGNPAPQLQQYSSERIKVLGFVEDVGPYFEDGLCLVAPLLLGAGIKIKVIEAMSAGIPVLTNEIGIEGIPAEKGRDYIHCQDPQDYIRAINTLDYELRKDISKNGKEFIARYFNLEKSAKEFLQLLENI